MEQTIFFAKILRHPKNRYFDLFVNFGNNLVLKKMLYKVD